MGDLNNQKRAWTYPDIYGRLTFQGKAKKSGNPQKYITNGASTGYRPSAKKHSPLLFWNWFQPDDQALLTLYITAMSCPMIPGVFSSASSILISIPDVMNCLQLLLQQWRLWHQQPLTKRNWFRKYTGLCKRKPAMWVWRMESEAGRLQLPLLSTPKDMVTARDWSTILTHFWKAAGVESVQTLARQEEIPTP